MGWAKQEGLSTLLSGNLPRRGITYWDVPMGGLMGT